MPEVSGVIRSFRPLPKQLTWAPAPRWISAHRRPINSDARRPVWAASPRRVWSRRPVQVDAVWCGEQRVEFRFGQEGHEPSLEAFGRNGEHALDHGGMLRVAKRCIPEQRSDRGEPSVAGAHAIFPLVLKMVEEGADQRGIEIVDVQLRWLRASAARTAKTSNSRRVSR